MTTPSQARETIYGAFKTAWADRTAYYFDNEVADPQDEEWVRLVVRHSLGDQETLGQTGDRKFKRGGRVIAQVFTKLDEGTARADILAQLVRNVFEGKTLDESVWFAGVAIREIGPDTKWYQTNVDAPFTYNETK